MNVYLTTEDDAVSPVINLERTAGTLVSNTINNSQPGDPAYGKLVDGASEEYFPETSNRGVGFAKWISRMFIFENECDGINLKLTACTYAKDSLRCYYRTRDVGFDGDLSELSWIPFNPQQELIETVVDPNQQNKLVDKKIVVPGPPDRDWETTD